MMWLGLAARVRIGALEKRISELQDSFEKLSKDFRALDVECSDHLDKLAGIAKRFTGRSGGRPPKTPEPNGDANREPDSPDVAPAGFSRHVL